MENNENVTNVNFNELGLNENVMKAVDAMGFEEPSMIQAKVIPTILNGNDVIGQAQTGTGKTLAFGAPILNNIKRGEGNIKCLIMTPTRELAIQVNDELVRIAKYSKVKLLPVYGGQPIDRQIKSIKNGVDIVVGTPGRIQDLIRRRILKLSEIDFLVIDEADEMLDMGFIDDIEEILKNCNPERQTMMFSATMPRDIKKLAEKYMKKDAQYISIIKNTMTVSTIDQYYYEIKQKDRFESLCRILDVDEPSSAIIFCKTKREVDEVVESMQVRGYNVEGMHGDMNQNQRLNTLKKFKEGNLEFLVATDVAARGIDVDNISHVINYNLPQDTDSYVHRIGRTGRAKKEGIAYTLVTAREYIALKQIEKTIKSKIKRKEIPTVDEIFLSKYKNIVGRIKETLEAEDYKKFVPLAAEMDDEFNLVDVAAALMNMVYDKEVSFDYTENNISLAPQVRLFVNLGRMDKIGPKQLVEYIADTANVRKDVVGNIKILDKFTFIDVAEDVAEDIVKYCSGNKLSGRKVRMEISNKN